MTLFLPSSSSSSPWRLFFSILICVGVFSKIRASYGLGLRDYLPHIVYKHNGNHTFQKMLVDSSTGDLFIGASNGLYKLSSELTLDALVEFGPRIDNVSCHNSHDNDCHDQRVMINQHIKVLLKHPTRSELLLCGSLYGGACAKISTDNISDITWINNSKPIVGIASDALFSNTAAVFTDEDHIFIANSRNARGLTMPNAALINMLNYSSGLVYSRLDVSADVERQFTTVPLIAFNFKGFTYFVVTEESEDGTFASFIGQICDGVSQIEKSYVDARLRSRYNSTQAKYAYTFKPGYKLSLTLDLEMNEELLYVVFNSTSGFDACVYRISDIHNQVTRAMSSCNGGIGRTGPKHLTTQRQCIRTNIADADCSVDAVNYPIRSEETIAPFSTFRFSLLSLSTMVVIASGLDTELYIATNYALLYYKMQVEDVQRFPFSGFPHLEGDEDAFMGITEILLSKDQCYLYLMTPSKVIRTELLDCPNYGTCSQCTSAAHVKCGWCELDNRCVPLAACGDGDPMSWSRECSGRVPAIHSVTPDRMPVHRRIKLKIQLSIDPFPSLELECVVVGITKEIRMKASRLPTNIIQCESVATWPEPPWPNVSAVFPVTLTAAGKEWLSTRVTVYDCPRNKRCGDCLTSDDQCVWHQSDATCTHFTTVNPYLLGPQWIKQGPQNCPRFESLTAEDPLLHAGIAGDVSLLGWQLEITTYTTYYCRFGDREVEAIVKRTGSTFNITCSNITLSYTEEKAFHRVPLSVLWGVKKLPLDNSLNLHLKLYKCKYLAASCGACRTLDHIFWCGDCGGTCSRLETCSVTWRDREQICTNPHITMVEPRAGPLVGGTRLTIHGTSLGHLREHVKVYMDGHSCDIQDYVPATSIICEAPPSNLTTNITVRVTIANTFTTSRNRAFRYADPILEVIVPTQGARAGGTRLTLLGDHLDGGSDLLMVLRSTRTKRQLGAQSTSLRSSSAILIGRAKREAEFETQQFVGDGDVELTVDVLMDSVAFSNPALTFTYSNDPVVYSVTPTITFSRVELTVHGQALQLIQQPQMVFYVTPTPRVTDCKLTYNRTDIMTCATPNLSDLDPSDAGGLTLHYGFIMDNVTSLLRVSKPGSHQLPLLQVFPDPKFDALAENAQFDLERPLILTGSDLGVLSRLRDVVVTVSGTVCNVTDMNQTTIVCMPTGRPKWLDKGRAIVEVSVGKVELFKDGLAVPTTPILLLILAVVLGSILVIAVNLALGIFCHYRHEKRKKAKLNTAMPDDPASVPLTSIRTGTEDGDSDKDTAKDSAGDAAPEVAEVIPSEVTPLASCLTVECESPACSDRMSSCIPDGEGDSDIRLVTSLLGHVMDEKLRETVKDILIPSEQLTLGEIVGKGHFGCVYSGQLKTSKAEEASIKVAIKTLQSRHLEPEAVESFLKEGVLMKNFEHPHVLKLLGVTMNKAGGGNPLVILPYMAGGDLRNYVKNKNRSFTARLLLHLGQQVAEGMAYLSIRGFIHRDLAARNCMVDGEECVKVADFGLSKDLYEKDYYSSMDRKRKMPIKWMALESLEDYIFTTKTDVWSFGVLLWELMIRGVTPYPDVDAFEMRNYLASGRRLRQPRFCPDNAYTLMAECWLIDPADRPTFADLVNRLELIVNPVRCVTHDASDLSDEPLYVNIQRQPSVDDKIEESDST